MSMSQEMADGEQECRSRSRDRGDELPHSPGTELPGEQRDDDHDHADHHGREHRRPRGVSPNNASLSQPIVGVIAP